MIKCGKLRLNNSLAPISVSPILIAILLLFDVINYRLGIHKRIRSGSDNRINDGVGELLPRFVFYAGRRNAAGEKPRRSSLVVGPAAS